MRTKEHGETPPEELETLSRIIADLNDQFFIEMGPEHRITLSQMKDRLDEDAALEGAVCVNTSKNVRIAFDYKVEQIIQEIVDQNFELYKRITDDPAFGDAIKNHLFDQYLHRDRSDGREMQKIFQHTSGFLTCQIVSEGSTFVWYYSSICAGSIGRGMVRKFGASDSPVEICRSPNQRKDSEENTTL